MRQLNWYGFYKTNNKLSHSYSHPDLEKGIEYHNFYLDYPLSSLEENTRKLNRTNKKYSFTTQQPWFQLFRRIITKAKIFPSIFLIPRTTSIIIILVKLSLIFRVIKCRFKMMERKAWMCFLKSILIRLLFDMWNFFYLFPQLSVQNRIANKSGCVR